MKTQVLSVDLPRIDGDTQSRVKINEDTVSDYADIITAAGTEWPFPPLDVFHDGTDHFVADGFHRLLGALRTKRGSLPCRVHKGTAMDARIFGMTANDQHGLRMTRADKRACVEWLLDNGGKLTQKVIAEKAGVAASTVRNIVADRIPSSVSKEKSTRTTGGTKGKLPFSPPAAADAPASPPTASEPDEPEITPEEPEAPATDADRGQCPNCAGSKWDEDEEGEVDCAKCHHPWGEPAGDRNEKLFKTLRSKFIKTAQAMQRVTDDLQGVSPGKNYKEAVKSGRRLVEIGKEW